MKKIFILIFIIISSKSFAVDKTTTFTIDKFNKAQSEGKIVVINSWNKTCYTCGKQIKILEARSGPWCQNDRPSRCHG